MSVIMVCGSRLYRSIRSLGGKQRERVGFKQVLTPRWVVMTTVSLAWSGEIIHRAAKVCGSIGPIFRDQICPLRLDSILEIWTLEVKVRFDRFSSSLMSARSVVNEESKFMTKCQRFPSRRRNQLCCQSNRSLLLPGLSIGSWLGPRLVSQRSRLAA